jgi:chemotaxis protein MotB
MDQARRDMDDLQRQLADARKQLADRPAGLPGDWQFQGGVAWTNIAEDVLFDSGKADVKAAGKTRLQDVARVIQDKFADCNIFVVGHTDAQPIRVSKNLWKDNLDLSLARGRNVAEALMTMGIERARVVCGGQGEWNPLVTADKPNVPQNRRVQIIAIRRPQEKATGAAAEG